MKAGKAGGLGVHRDNFDRIANRSSDLTGLDNAANEFPDGKNARRDDPANRIGFQGGGGGVDNCARFRHDRDSTIYLDDLIKAVIVFRKANNPRADRGYLSATDADRSECIPGTFCLYAEYLIGDLLSGHSFLLGG
jgi:hypothetical protein